jgi:6-phospho-beta-glucosidase
VSVRIAVVGGGSTYTPELVEGFLARHDRLPVDELVLYDIDADRLSIVGGLADRMAEQAGVGMRVVSTTSREAALDGADFVVVQLRVGGQAARLIDETLPPRYGTIGQETVGAGGVAKALRTVPVVLDLAEEAARRASTGAWIVNFTNPVGIVTQALLDEGHRAIGLCNVAIGFQRDLARRLGVDPARVELDHVGLNHLSWIRAVCVDGIDRLPELLETDAPELATQVGAPVELVRSLRAIPSYYLRYFYRPGEVLAEQRAGHTRAAEVIEIERRLLDRYRDPELTSKPDLLTQRGGAYYSEAAAQLIASLHAGTGDVQVVDTRNGGALPELPPKAVVELRARIDAAGATPLPTAPLEPDQRALVLAVKGAEELAVRAAVTGDRALARRAMLAHPLVRDWAIAAPLLDALLEAHAAHLPRFARLPG